MNLFSKTLMATALIGATTFAMANTAVNHSAIAPISTQTVKNALTLKMTRKYS